MQTAILNARVDPKLKEEFTFIANSLGTTPQNAIKMLVTSFVDNLGFPYECKLSHIPNKETLDAMIEADKDARNPAVKSYDDVNEMFSDILV